MSFPAVYLICALASASLPSCASEQTEVENSQLCSNDDQPGSAGEIGQECGATPEIDTRKSTTYKKASITSLDDFAIKELLDQADTLISQGRFDAAREAYSRILQDHPLSPRAHFGRATALENLWQKSGSIAQLKEAVNEFDKVLQLADTPDPLFIAATQRLVEGRIYHLERPQSAVDAQLRLVERFPERIDFKNALALTYFKMSGLLDGPAVNTKKLDDCRAVFAQVLRADPNNGFAQAYYGYILVQHDKNLNEGVELLMRGLRSKAAGTKHELFYQILGSALIMLARRQEASEIFEDAADLGLLLSPIQRSMHNVVGLTARPFWTVEQTGYASQLAAIGKAWRLIRDEAVNYLATQTISPTPEHKGERVDHNCELMPRSCEIVERAPDATSCKRGQIKVSALEPGTVVLPHTGPTNCRIRAHLGLHIPPGAHLRVAGEERTLREGEWIVFDDSFEHEVWHDGDQTRIILIVDFWHPDLTPEQRSKLEPIP